jgi:hypothetical protein
MTEVVVHVFVNFKYYNAFTVKLIATVTSWLLAGTA